MSQKLLPRTVSEDSFQTVGVGYELMKKFTGSLGAIKTMVSFLPQDEAIKLQQLNRWFYECGVSRVQFKIASSPYTKEERMRIELTRRLEPVKDYYYKKWFYW